MECLLQHVWVWTTIETVHKWQRIHQLVFQLGPEESIAIVLEIRSEWLEQEEIVGRYFWVRKWRDGKRWSIHVGL